MANRPSRGGYARVCKKTSSLCLGESQMKFPLFAAVLLVLITGLTVDAQPVSLLGINPDDIPSKYPTGFNEPSTNQTWGWGFHVSSPITVTDVAWYDANGDGLSHAHRIGLWKIISPIGDPGPSDLNLLGSLGQGVVVPSGTSAVLDGPWRKTAIPGGPLVLPVGDYLLGGENNANSTDPVKFANQFTANFGTDSRIYLNYLAGHSSADGFHEPDFSFLVKGVELGPNLFVQPIPEPSPYLLASAGCCGIAARRRFWRRRGQWEINRLHGVFPALVAPFGLR